MRFFQVSHTYSFHPPANLLMSIATWNSSSLVQNTSLNQSSFVDLSSLVSSNGSVQWMPPDATRSWKIFSFWESYTNQRSCDGGPNPTSVIGNGSWIVDHFSKVGASRVTDFWNDVFLSDSEIAELVKTVGNYGTYHSRPVFVF